MIRGMRKFFASLALMIALVAAGLVPASPAQAHYTNCRSEGWCMWLYPNWENPGHNGWQWDAAWIAARPGGKLSFSGQQWNNYTAGWMLNSSIFNARLYQASDCTGTYLFFGTDQQQTNLKFASTESGGLNHAYYRTASCVHVFMAP